MSPHITQSRKQLGYPLYAADFDPLNPDFLLVGGGGGSSATGVPNKISLLDVSRSHETAEITDIELAKDEDSVTTLAVVSSSETSLTAIAGINSSVAEQDSGKNDHLRSFRISLPARKRKADGTQVGDEKALALLPPPNALGKTALFTSARGPRNETYQRVLRSAPIQSANEPRLTAIASGLAPENEVIAFQPVSNTLTSSTVDEISRINLGKTEAADVDVIAVKGVGHVLAYCTDDSVYVQRLPGTRDSKIDPPVRTYQSPSATDSTAPKQRPKFRALRFLTPEHVLLLQNRPGRTGASLLILKIGSTGNGHVTFIKHLNKAIKLATGLDTAILRSPSSQHFQAVISVASQDSSIDLLTIDYTPSAGLSAFRHYALLRHVHSGPLTRLVFSNFIPPSSPEPKHTSRQRIKLASVGLDKVVVVHTLTLRRSTSASTSDQAPRFVLVPSGGNDVLQTTISAFTAIMVLLLAALLTQAFYEIRGTVPPRLGVAHYLPANIRDPIGQPVITSATAPDIPAALSTAIEVIQDAPSRIPPAKGEGESARVGAGPETKLKRWDELSAKEKRGWKEKLKSTGFWVEQQGDKMPTAQEIIKKLNLSPHPEKGFYIQTFLDPAKVNGRSYSTAIYYLLERGNGQSNWHRIFDGTEIWHYYAGAPIRLSLSWNDGAPVRNKLLGPDVLNGQEPQIILQQNEWQSAESLGDWTLAGCTVTPAFDFDKFEIKEPGWQPKGA
ncbi:hypothetical protein DV737_g2959, partial [Chaetothyriales sp. CBS 132003]